VILAPPRALAQQQAPGSRDIPDRLAAAKATPFPDFDARTFAVLGGAAAATRPAAALSQTREDFAAAIEAAGLREAKFALWNSGRIRSLSASGAPLSESSNAGEVETIHRFLSRHRSLFQMTEREIQDLRLLGRSENQGGIFLNLQQVIQGAPVFGGFINAALSGSGQIVSVNLGELAISGPAAPAPAWGVEEAIGAALRMHAGPAETPASLGADDKGRLLFENPFGRERSSIRAELLLFPSEAFAPRWACRIFLDVDDAHWFELVVDAENGSLLFRQNLYRQVAQGRVWKISPLQGQRELVNFPEGWLSPGGTLTTGNNADAYLDSDSNDLPDQTLRPNIQQGRAFSDSQVFDFPFGEGSSGMNPRGFAAAAVTNLFYLANEAHDYFYGLGFDEASGNFQTDNFLRGGVGGDAVRVEAQDGLNNAIFGTAPDGIPPRGQFGLFDLRETPSLTDDRDSSYDAQVVIHELAHGLTSRLVGGPDTVGCLGGIQSRGMGEGWSDYFSSSYTNDPVQGGYSAADLQKGIRRHSYENYPFTYEDLGNDGFDLPHDEGEIWAAVLWDLRKEIGRQVTDRLAVSGLRTIPCDPSMIDARDGILQADAVTGGARRAKLWEVFARHGMGHAARGLSGDNFVEGTVFTASFDQPPDLKPGNRTPVVTSQPPLAMGIGTPYAYSVVASDPDSDTLLYTLTEGPLGMAINSTTGRLTWTATFTGQRAKVTVSDGRGGAAVHGFYIPVLTQLSLGQPVLIAGEFLTIGSAGVTVPNGTAAVQFTMRGGTGEPDMRVNGPDGSLHAWPRNGTAETLTIADPAPGLWLVQVLGFEPYANVSLRASLPTATTIQANVPAAGLSGEGTSEIFYRVTIPAGIAALRVSTSGGTGDVDLYVRQGGFPVCQNVLGFFIGLLDCKFDSYSSKSGNIESVEILNPAPGDWFINMMGFSAYAGVTLIAETVRPSISSGGIVLSTQTPRVAQASSRSIISVYGAEFAAPGTIMLDPALDEDQKVATKLANTCLEVNGHRSAIFAVLPAQINAQISDKVLPGAASAVVLRNCGTNLESRSAPMNFTVAEVSPAFFNFVNQESGVNPIAAVHGGGPDLVGTPGLLPGGVFTPTEPGKIASLFGTGFGSTNPPLAVGEIPLLTYPDLNGVAPSTHGVSVSIGGIVLPTEDVFYAGAAPCCAGLDQLVVRVPANAPDGNLPVILTINGVSTPTGPYITVKKP
jgi:uncharacterized protein (TIGR03437 family)